MHLSRRSVSVMAIALTFVGWISASAVARGEASPATAPDPVANGFEPRSVVFTSPDRGAAAGTLVCRSCAQRHTAAVASTMDGGATWSSPITFGSRVATDLVAAPGTDEMWASVGRRLAHSADGGTTWSDLGPVVGREMLSADVWFVSDAEGLALVQRPHGAPLLVGTTDGGDTWANVVAFPAS